MACTFSMTFFTDLHDYQLVIYNINDRAPQSNQRQMVSRNEKIPHLQLTFHTSFLLSFENTTRTNLNEAISWDGSREGSNTMTEKEKFPSFEHLCWGMLVLSFLLGYKVPKSTFVLLPMGTSFICWNTHNQAGPLRDTTHCWQAQHKVCAHIIKILTQTSECDPESQTQNSAWRLGETLIYLSSFRLSLLERVTVILILTNSLGNLLHFKSVQNNGMIPNDSFKTALKLQKISLDLHGF